MNLNTLFTRPARPAGRPASLGFIFARTLLVLVVISTLTAQTAFSKAAPKEVPVDAPALPTWNKTVVDGPPLFFNMTDRALAFSPTGTQPCVAYGGDGLYFSCYNYTTKVWSTEVVDASLRVGEYAAMVMILHPQYGVRPFISYFDAYNGRLKVAYKNLANVWQIEVVPDVINTMPDGSLVVPASREGDNAARNSETDQPESLLMRDRLQQILEPWVKPDEDPKFSFESTGYGKFSSIAVDRNNGIHISYHDEVFGALEYQYFNGEEWKGKVVDDYHDQYDVGLWSSIAVEYSLVPDSTYSFNIHIAYMSEKYDDLKYAKHKLSGGWIVENVDTANHVGSFSSLALDKYDRPHISYFDFSTDNLKYAWRDKDGVWHREVVDGTGIMGWWTSIAVDPSDRVHISYYNVSKGDLRYAVRDHSNWTLRTLDTTSANNTNRGLYTSLALDPGTNLPGIVYYDAGNGVLKFIQQAKNADNRLVWRAPIYVNYYSRDVGIDSSLAVTPAGVPYISYMDATTGNLKWARAIGKSWYRDQVLAYPNAGLYSSLDLSPAPYYYPRIGFYAHNTADLKYSGWNGFNWTFADVDRTNNVGMYNSLKIDSTGIPHLSYYDATREDLVYGTWTTVYGVGKWFTQTLDIRNVKGWYTDLALSPGNFPFISYYDLTTGSLKLAYQSTATGTWITRLVDNVGLLEGKGVGAYTSIEIDSQGRPHIVYYDLTNQDLKYAFWDGVWGGPGVWNISVIDSAGDVGRFASLAINPIDGARHVCFYDMSNGNLKYATATGANPWELQVVDGAVGLDGDVVDEGDVGMYCSIDLTAAGQPAISYYDNSRGDLKIALSYPLPPFTIFLPITQK